MRQEPLRTPFGVCGLAWFRGQDFGWIENLCRDELLARLTHFGRQAAILDQHIERLADAFPQAEALTEIHGIGLYSALLIVAENIERTTRSRTSPADAGPQRGIVGRVSAQYSGLGTAANEQYTMRRAAGSDGTNG